MHLELYVLLENAKKIKASLTLELEEGATTSSFSELFFAFLK